MYPYYVYQFIYEPSVCLNNNKKKVRHKPVKQLESLQDQTEVQKVHIFCPFVATPSKVHALDLLPVQKGTSDCI